jgi:hypothetical protein
VPSKAPGTRAQQAPPAAAPTAAEVHAQRLEQLRLELQTCKLGALSKRASADGVESSALEDALDAEDAKACVIELILVAQPQQVPPATAADDGAQVLRAELSGLKISALKRRAMQCGVAESSLDEAEDSDQPTKQAVVDLIVAASDMSGQHAASPTQGRKQLETATKAQRPHHGSSVPSPSRPILVEQGGNSAQYGKAAPISLSTRSTADRRHSTLLGGKHAMLSCKCLALCAIFACISVPSAIERAPLHTLPVLPPTLHCAIVFLRQMPGVWSREHKEKSRRFEHAFSGVESNAGWTSTAVGVPRYMHAICT